MYSMIYLFYNDEAHNTNTVKVAKMMEQKFGGSRN